MKKGFTLLELLIVIGILAILATAAVLVLNPAELLRQARDSSRLADMASLNSALGLYVTDVSPIVLTANGDCRDETTPNYFTSFSGGVTEHATATADTLFTAATSASSSRDVDGTGWIPVNFVAIGAGAPFGSLPVDPTNDATYNYQYECDNTESTWELNGPLESTKFSNGGSDDRESTDGGNQNYMYESGTVAGLDH